MLPPFIRKLFYALYESDNPALRMIANGVCLGFIACVRLCSIKPRQDCTPLTVISHRYQFIYFGIPKTGTRALREFFGQSDFAAEIFEHRKGYEDAVKQYPDYYKFTFVRNPFARVLSCYESKVAPRKGALHKRARILSFYRELRSGMEFKDFVLWLGGGEGCDEIADRHWLSQHYFTDQCDFVGRYENLQGDLKMIGEKLGFSVSNVPVAGWISGASDYQDRYDAEMINVMRSRYARDLEQFGYEF